MACWQEMWLCQRNGQSTDGLLAGNVTMSKKWSVNRWLVGRKWSVNRWLVGRKCDYVKEMVSQQMVCWQEMWLCQRNGQSTDGLLAGNVTMSKKWSVNRWLVGRKCDYVKEMVSQQMACWQEMWLCQRNGQSTDGLLAGNVTMSKKWSVNRWLVGRKCDYVKEMVSQQMACWQEMWLCQRNGQSTDGLLAGNVTMSKKWSVNRWLVGRKCDYVKEMVSQQMACWQEMWLCQRNGQSTDGLLAGNVTMSKKWSVNRWLVGRKCDYVKEMVSQQMACWQEMWLCQRNGQSTDGLLAGNVTMSKKWSVNRWLVGRKCDYVKEMVSQQMACWQEMWLCQRNGQSTDSLLAGNVTMSKKWSVNRWLVGRKCDYVKEMVSQQMACWQEMWLCQRNGQSTDGLLAGNVTMSKKWSVNRWLVGRKCDYVKEMVSQQMACWQEMWLCQRNGQSTDGLLAGNVTMSKKWSVNRWLVGRKCDYVKEIVSQQMACWQEMWLCDYVKEMVSQQMACWQEMWLCQRNGQSTDGLLAGNVTMSKKWSVNRWLVGRKCDYVKEMVSQQMACWQEMWLCQRNGQSTDGLLAGNVTMSKKWSVNRWLVGRKCDYVKEMVSQQMACWQEMWLCQRNGQSTDGLLAGNVTMSKKWSVNRWLVGRKCDYVKEMVSQQMACWQEMWLCQRNGQSTDGLLAGNVTMSKKWSVNRWLVGRKCDYVKEMVSQQMACWQEMWLCQRNGQSTDGLLAGNVTMSKKWSVNRWLVGRKCDYVKEMVSQQMACWQEMWLCQRNGQSTDGLLAGNVTMSKKWSVNRWLVGRKCDYVKEMVSQQMACWQEMWLCQRNGQSTDGLLAGNVTMSKKWSVNRWLVGRKCDYVKEMVSQQMACWQEMWLCQRNGQSTDGLLAGNVTMSKKWSVNRWLVGRKCDYVKEMVSQQMACWQEMWLCQRNGQSTDGLLAGNVTMSKKWSVNRWLVGRKCDYVKEMVSQQMACWQEMWLCQRNGQSTDGLLAGNVTMSKKWSVNRWLVGRKCNYVKEMVSQQMACWQEMWLCQRNGQSTDGLLAGNVTMSKKWSVNRWLVGRKCDYVKERYPLKDKSYKSYVRPAMLYGSEAWCLSEMWSENFIKDRKIHGESIVSSTAQR